MLSKNLYVWDNHLWLLEIVSPKDFINCFIIFWNVSFVPVRVLHKDEKILGRKHIYLPHAQTAIYDSKVVIFKTGNILSTWSWVNAIVRYEFENSAIDVIINFLWKIFGGFSNFCRYYTRSQAGKSTGPLWNPWG